MPRPWILALFLVSCGDSSETGDTGPSGGAPDIAADPVSLDFGLQPLETSAQESVEICNHGDAHLAISEIEVGQVSAPFVLSPLTEPVLDPGACTTVTVTFTPLQPASWDTRLWIHNNDPDQPRLGVPLLGTGGSPAIQITPASTDFGTVWFKCSVEQDITISNVGTSELTILDWSYDTDTKDLSFTGIWDENGSAEGLVTLAAGASWTGTVTYAPTDGDLHTAILTVTSTDLDQPEVQATQTGDGTPGGTITDTFLQARWRAPDVLVAVDRTSSMAGEMASVESNLDIFLDELLGSRYDYQLAAVVEDTGCVRGSYNFLDTTYAASTAVPAFATMLDLYGDPGEYSQQGFRLADRALAAAAPGGCNEGLLRDDTRLHVIGISDGPDQSPAEWDDYVDAWNALRPELDMLAVHAVGGDWPDGCVGAEPYDGFYQASGATGGSFFSICGGAWGKELAGAILAEVVLKDAFTLTESPVAASISVAVDGKVRTTGWLYDAPNNAVRFTVATIPEEGATVEITYDVAGGC